MTAFGVSCALAIGCSAACADGPLPGFRALYSLILDRPTFEETCDVLGLDDHQRVAAEAIFAQYRDAVQAIDNQTYDRMLDAGLAAVLALQDDARRAQRPIRNYREKTRHHYVAAHREMVLGQRRADALLSGTLSALQLLLVEDQLPRYEAVPALVRRRAFQRDVQGDDFSASRSSLPLLCVVEVEALVDAAVSDDGELRCMGADREADIMGQQGDEAVRRPHAGSENCDCRARIAPLLREYQQDLDVLILSSLDRQRRLPPTGEPGDQATSRAERQHQRARRLWWNSLYDLNHATKERIALVLVAEHGTDAERRWRARFDRALCPRLMDERWPDRMVEWLEARPDRLDDQLYLAVAQHLAYLAEYDVVRHEALRAGLRAQRIHGYPLGSEPSQLDYCRGILALRKLIARTIRRFEGVLTTEQADALEGELGRWHYSIDSGGFAFGSGRLFGPQLYEWIVHELEPGYVPPPRIVDNPGITWTPDMAEYYDGRPEPADQLDTGARNDEQEELP